ncbi:sensor histidine kinase [Sulfobacillus harzensis]|uniref:histidine kinase n=1 Tax=Sulfobacillus harzensis TaxID=2729629 RepID=A0A7Y0LAC9_9FIRM|nr:HAMP domain-containing sensor histidine kinase [Sulfobacillus harzensis]NMP24789.1 HAMP domain-containing histidine kinase [Sulfobacillus harzensis]
MFAKTLDEVVRWAQSLGLPVIAAERDNVTTHSGIHYRTKLSGTHLDWYFNAPVPESIPLLLTRIVEERMELKEQRFTVDALVHELRNPLSVAVGHLELLVRDPAGEKFQERIEAMNRALSRIARQLDWVSHQNDEPIHLGISLRDIWEGIVADLKPEWAPRSIEWVYHGSSAFAYTDPWRVEQILFNLAKNALEASPDHAVIRAESYSLCDDLVFRVTNAGSHLSPEETDRLFERKPSAKGVGHGLGLALSQRLAKSIGGRIAYFPDADGVSFMLIL